MIKHFLEFLRALTLAGVRQCLVERSSYCLTAPFHILLALMSSKGGSEKAEERLRDCEDCPIYERRFKTCGNAVDPIRGNSGEPLGCFCYMPLKVTLPGASCWINDQTGLHIGWRRESE